MSYGMKYRKVGKLMVSPEGLGTMGMSEFYGAADRTEAIKTIQTAHKNGINFFDTADVYGYGDNEILVGEALRDYPRDSYYIATKGGILRDRVDTTKRGVDNSPEYMRAAVEASLKRLGVSYIDLYYVHRIANQGKNIETTMVALAELVKAGLIRNIGLSEASAEVISRAHTVHPVAAVQIEYSLWRRGPEIDGTMEICRKLGIAFVAYSPLGRGFLTGTIKPEDLEKDDFRKSLPRFQGENFEHNMKIAKAVQDMAKEKNCTAAQLVIAWVLAQGDNVIPIPGTKREKYLLENIAAMQVNLTPLDLERLNDIAPVGAAKGTRYAPAAMTAYGFEDDEPPSTQKKSSYVVYGEKENPSQAHNRRMAPSE